MAKNYMHTAEELRQLQALPLKDKVKISRERIREWYEHWDGQVYISYSGGKDSNALLHLVRSMYPDVPAVFINTGLEFPEVQEFVKNTDNVIIFRPKMTFRDVIIEYGYPVISKNVASSIEYARRFDMSGHGRKDFWEEKMMVYAPKKGTMQVSRYCKARHRQLAEEAPFKISDRCCNAMKKKTAHDYSKESGRKPFLGTMTEESMLRENAWLTTGCNAFNRSGTPTSTPMAFWVQNDVLEYIKVMGIEIPSVYGDIVEEISTEECPDCTKYKTTGLDRTGCVNCGFGAHCEKKVHRYLLLKESHPRLYEYCIKGGEWVDNPSYDPSIPEYADDGFKNWNPPKLWQPSKDGLGMGYVFDFINSLPGKAYIPY